MIGPSRSILPFPGTSLTALMMASFWEKIRRTDFPIAKKFAYLDHASGGPIPAPVHRKILEYYQEHLRAGDLAWGKWIRRREEVRAKVAKFIGASAEEVTFIPSTSQGMNYVAEILANQGTVLTNESEFPSSTLPWIWRKAKIVYQKAEAMDRPPSSVKTIVTSFVQYATGFRQDLAAIGRAKKNRYLVVNATQGFGAFPIDVKKSRIDFLCSNSYKWLMAGYGGGIFYMNKKWLARFRPASVGWRSMCEPERMDNQRTHLKSGASRYEMGCPPFPAIFAVGAAVDYLTLIGIERIAKRILELTDFVIEGLEKRGFEVVSTKDRKHRSGIVVFKVKDAAKIQRRLLKKKIYVSPRGAGLRVSPHFYNTFEDLEKLLKALES